MYYVEIKTYHSKTMQRLSEEFNSFVHNTKNNTLMPNVEKI